MPVIDRIIQFLQAEQGSHILIESNQNCVMYREGQRATTPHVLTDQQIRHLINEILPGENRLAWARGESFVFEYAHPAGAVPVEVNPAPGLVRVKVVAPGTQTAESAPAGHEAPAEGEPVRRYTGPLRRLDHIDDLLRHLYDIEGSDLHLNSGVSPMVRVHGDMKELEEFEHNGPDHLLELLWEITPQRNREQWEQDHDSDFSYEIPGLARFRCNIFMDRHGPGANFRLIPNQIRTAQDLNLTKEMLELCFLSKGLVLVTGPTGTGKSTTLAALVDHVNRHRTDHMITIEDPIEFVHNNINCLVNQREVHTHTTGFARSLRAALREDPDIVLVGEMRDLETVAIAIETAETGHLVFATLHTSTAASTVDRIIDQFPPDQQEQIRVMLSESLKAVIAQTLCRTKEGRRVAAFEVLLVDPASANLIREGKTFQLPSMMQIGRARGCITMNDALYAHVKAGRIEPSEAYFKAVDKPGLLAIFEAEGVKMDAAAARV